MDLYRHSVATIIENQAPSGAYMACPFFNNYRYSWLRDGSYIAHAMDCAGRPESAAKFFRWVNATIVKHAHKVSRIESGIAQGLPPGKIEFLHTRYTVDGDEETADSTWGNFQPDGYGTWLWALGEHIRLTGDLALLGEIWDSILLTVRYLAAVWQFPTYDCWEERPEFIHPYTLGAIYTGLQAARRLAHEAHRDLPLDAGATAEKIRTFLLEFGVRDGHLVKSIDPRMDEHPKPDGASNGVDASLLALAVPFEVFKPNDPIYRSTFEKVECEIHYPGGGVYRYSKDTYYGGGEWLLLAGMLGWQAAMANDRVKARTLLEWIAGQADTQGNLPEQVSDHVLFPEYLPLWKSRWGEIASPLLWSHAMYLILFHAINGKQ